MSRTQKSKKLLSPKAGTATSFPVNETPSPKFQPWIFQTFFGGCMQIVFNMTGVFSLGVNIGPAT
jgi:hypothetical protein